MAVEKKFLIVIGSAAALGIALAAPFQIDVCEPAAIEGHSHCASYQIVVGTLLRAMAFFDRHEGFFVGLFTAALFIATLRLWRSTQALVEGADDTARRELRAYLGITEMTLHPRTVTEPVTYKIQIKNFGKTPAFSVSASMTRKVLTFPLADDYQMVEDPDADDFRSYMTILPTADATVTSSRNDPPLSDMHFRHALDGPDGVPDQMLVYCYGTIRYRDVFGELHWAHYCKAFGGGHYRRSNGRPAAMNVYNDSSDDPQPGVMPNGD